MRKLLLLAALLFPSLAIGQTLSPYSDIVLTARGTPAGLTAVSVCQNPGLATTAASVTSNVAILTFGSSPVTAGFVANMSLTVSGFTGADTYFNGSFTILQVTSTTIAYALVHANASASSNGSAFQTGNTATSCAPLSSIFSDPAGANPVTQPGFTADGLGNFAFYAAPGAYNIQFSGPVLTVRVKPVNIPCIPGITCAATNVVGNWTALQNFNAGLTASFVTSQTANPAGTGVLRLANGDSIKWRNNANSADLLLGTNGGANGNIPADLFQPQNGFLSSAYVSSASGANVALTGVLRLASGDTICWRNLGNSADNCIAEVTGNLVDLSGFAGTKNANVLLSGTIQNNALTATMGLTLKKGSGSGNYTNATTTYAVVDNGNLCFTVTIPTGWKLSVAVSGAIGTATGAVLDNFALTDNASCSTANSGILVESVSTTTAAGTLEPFALNWIINGDGAVHNVALQFKTSNGADAATILNASATQVPTMTFLLMPSN